MKSKYTLLVSGTLAVAMSVLADTKLEAEFEKAFKEGKTLTAERVFRSLTEKRDNVSPVRYWQAAELARQMRKSSLRRDRLSRYMAVEKKWTPEVEQAAYELCFTATDARAFEKLAKNVPASSELYRAGSHLLWSLRTEKRTADFMQVASTMLEKFNDKEKRLAVANHVKNFRFDYPPGFSYASALELLAKYKDIAGSDAVNMYIDLCEKSLDAKWLADYCFNGKARLGHEFFERHFIPKVGNIKDDKLRRDVIKKMFSLESEYLKVSKTPRNSELAFLQVYGRFYGRYARYLGDGVSATEAQSKQNLEFLKRLIGVLPKTDSGRAVARAVSSEMIAGKAVLTADITPYALANHEYFTAGDLCNLSKVAEKSKEKNSLQPVKDLIKLTGNRYDVRWNLLGQIAAFGDLALLTSTIEEHISNDWYNTDIGNIFNKVSSSASITDDKKIAILERCFNLTGYIRPWAWFTGRNAENLMRTHKFLTLPAGKAFLSKIKTDVKSSDQFFVACSRIYGLNRAVHNTCPEEAHKLAEATVKAYLQLGPKAPTRRKALDSMLSRYAYLCEASSVASVKFIKTLKPLFEKSYDNWDILWRVFHAAMQRGGDESAVWDIALLRAKRTGDAYMAICHNMPEGYTAIPKDFKYNELLFDKVSAFIIRHLVNNRIAKPEDKMAALNVLFKHPGFNLNDGNMISSISRSILPIINQPVVVKNFPWKEALDNVIRKDVSRDGASARIMYDMFARAGKRKEALDAYVQEACKLNGYVRIHWLFMILDCLSFPRNNNEVQSGVVDIMTPFIKDYLLPQLSALKSKEIPLVYLGNERSDWDAFNNWCAVNRENKEKAALVLNLSRQMGRLLNGNCQGFPAADGAHSDVFVNLYKEALANSNTFDMAECAALVGATSNPRTFSAVYNLLQKTREGEFWESAYLMSSSIPGDRDQSLVTLSMRVRAEAAAHLPGVYPVDEKHPAYPLYVAADELSRKNSERAWEILKRNITVFEREAINLPPDFTAWGVEQLRLSRGKKDESLIKARQIATALLNNESRIIPDLAAAMLLVRAECFRDQQNFEAAKLEYQSIRNNPKYNSTAAGRKAMFRAVDLMIETGNVSGAESTIEYWHSQPDPEIQAQAHYFAARIAFDRKDYDTTIKELREVFAIDFTHTEARFLQGKWKLATNNEVDDTDVMIGDLSDRTVIRPGQQLTITVQDRNLSVAGGGSSIPIILTAKPGGDTERILLYPSSRDPNLFKGVVDVKLAEAFPSNLVLEVQGNDLAQYEIERDFLLARGLPLNKPKVLRVIDDAKLSIGAGAPRAEEKETELALEDSLEGSFDSSALSSALRPGNPLYVVVRDRDRSTGKELGEVAVSVKTTSGDSLENVVLSETKPYSGVFRAQIPTSLPPPRAFASDTSAGFNTGDVINKNKSGEWRSLADGQIGKWIEVDTMASHRVSNATIKVKNPQEIRAINLVGRLGTETIRLGSLPAGDIKKRIGIKRQSEMGFYTRSAQAIRARFARVNAPSQSSVSNFSYDVSHNYPRQVITYWKGAFCQPKEFGYMRLRIVAKNTQGKTFAGLWMEMHLDGEQVFQGQGPSLHNRIVTFDVPLGAHRFELFASTVHNEDSFDILWEPIGEEAKPIPYDWFDADKNSSILKFLEDKAKIVRTEEGFSATFPHPVRLRSLRWEFADRVGLDVSVSKMTIVDSKGETIIPCDSDFSDAQKNNTLEVAPGDSISVTYQDDVTSSGEKRVLHKSMRSSFNNAQVNFYFEHIDESRSDWQRQQLHQALRFQPGDVIIASVVDADADFTPEADTISAVITTSSGQRKELKLIEQSKGYAGVANVGANLDGVHSGLFMALIKTANKDDANAPANALKVTENDMLTLAYEDRENTNPGVPYVRVAKVQAVRKSEPIITLFNTTRQRVVDNSPTAKAKLEKIRRRAGNETVKALYRDVLSAVPMEKSVSDSAEPILVNVATPILVRVNDPARARHAASRIKLRASSASESIEIPMELAKNFAGIDLRKGAESIKEAYASGSFNGSVKLRMGPPDPNEESLENKTPELGVTGSDNIKLEVLSENGDVVLSRMLKLVSNANLALMDSTYTAPRDTAHVGEKFFVQVEDADRDLSEETDLVDVTAIGLLSGTTNTIRLSETLPHSGIFTGMYPSRMYGDNVVFSYRDELTLPGTPVTTHSVTGRVFRGSDGSVRMFSKRFRDSDMAVLVQFRLAECLFEQAKEHRKLKQFERSSKAIDEGKHILEEALKNYPDSSHVAQGEYLLANLYQELATEKKDAKDISAAMPLYTEALARFSTILSTWPDGAFAAKSQYHKALCLEMLGDYARASEEYVKMTYLYPDSELVGDATIRLATYYYKEAQRFDISGKIYQNFQRRFPTHEKAPRALFMSGSCYVKQAEAYQKKYKENNPNAQVLSREASEMYRKAVSSFASVAEKYAETASPAMRAQALYWAGDAALRVGSYEQSYLYLKRTVFEFPETEWARRARGLLLQEERSFKDME